VSVLERQHTQEVGQRQATLRHHEAILLLCAVAVGWGTAWPVIKTILEDIPPLWTLVLRSTIGTATLFAISAGRRSLVLPKRGDAAVVLNVSLLHMVAFAALVSVGLQFVPAGRSIVLGYTTPLWVSIGARIFLGEALTPARVTGIGVGVLGLLLLFNPFSFAWQDHQAVVGNLLVLIGSLCWAASIVHVRAHRWVSSPFELVPWQVLLATCTLVPLALLFEGIPRVEWTARLIALLLYGGTAGLALPYWAMQMINKSVPAITTALALLAVPVVGVICSSIMLGERLTAGLLLAMLFIVGGIAIGMGDSIVGLWGMRRKPRTPHSSS
jgi:drug/metabolite transporter (DMT)-like permease